MIFSIDKIKITRFGRNKLKLMNNKQTNYKSKSQGLNVNFQTDNVNFLFSCLLFYSERKVIICEWNQ